MLKRCKFLAAALFVVAAPAAALAAAGNVTEAVNMRAGPGAEYPVVDIIQGGAPVNIHGCLSDRNWCDVTWGSDRGWVSASYLDYLYNNNYVYLPTYYDRIGVPLVTFVLEPYWNNYYSGRPWYGQRQHWGQVWREHGRYGESSAGQGGRRNGAAAPAIVQPSRPVGAIGNDPNRGVTPRVIGGTRQNQVRQATPAQATPTQAAPARVAPPQARHTVTAPNRAAPQSVERPAATPRAAPHIAAPRAAPPVAKPSAARAAPNPRAGRSAHDDDGSKEKVVR